MTIPFDTLRDKWMADPFFRGAFDRVGPAMEIAFMIAEARQRANLSQAQLAAKVGTSAAMVARWEKGVSSPTTATLGRIAEATGSRLTVQLSPA